MTQLDFLFIISRQGKLRLSKWYKTLSSKDKESIIKEATHLILSRDSKKSNFVDFRGSTLVYRRYAGIFFVTAISKDDNELITLEYIHRYVEILDKYFNNVCELDIIFNYQKAYFILDEIITFGHFYNSNRNDALQAIALQETFEDTETLQQVWPDIK
ncbi:hypothetical protein DSO57_1028996 [Entomophthora muscae]|nr:hypothetical protein DSO57_1015241 [Entomophthora muscae]KAJ9080070.1 hypothetical protein DSO57_1028996 [Entomophthora muscae]